MLHVASRLGGRYLPAYLSAAGGCVLPHSAACLQLTAAHSPRLPAMPHTTPACSPLTTGPGSRSSGSAPAPAAAAQPSAGACGGERQHSSRAGRPPAAGTRPGRGHSAAEGTAAAGGGTAQSPGAAGSRGVRAGSPVRPRPAGSPAGRRQKAGGTCRAPARRAGAGSLGSLWQREAGAGLQTG